MKTEAVTVSEETTNTQPSPAAEAPVRLTPLEWGRGSGKVKRSPLWFGEGQRGDIKTPDYAAAEHLHGWIEAELRGRPEGSNKLVLTREDFDAALKAALSADKAGNYTPHPAALALHLRGDK
jgi:hypothetical protein